MTITEKIHALVRKALRKGVRRDAMRIITDPETRAEWHRETRVNETHHSFGHTPDGYTFEGVLLSVIAVPHPDRGAPSYTRVSEVPRADEIVPYYAPCLAVKYEDPVTRRRVYIDSDISHSLFTERDE